MSINLDLLEYLAAPSWLGAAALDEETPRLATEIILSRPELLATSEGRRTALLEAVRQTARQNFAAIVGKPASLTRQLTGRHPDPEPAPPAR